MLIKVRKCPESSSGGAGHRARARMEHFQSCLLSQMTWLRGDKSTLEPGAAFDDCNLDVGCQWRLPWRWTWMAEDNAQRCSAHQPSAWPSSPAGRRAVRRAGRATAVEDANNRQCHFAITSCHSKTSSLPSMREKNWEKFQPKLVTANFIFSSLDCDREKHSSKHFSNAFHSLQ